VLCALKLLGAASQHTSHPAVRGCCGTSRGSARRGGHILDEPTTAVEPQVEKCSTPETAVRTRALLYLAQPRIDPLDRIEKLGEFGLLDRAAMVSFLSQPGGRVYPQHRRRAAAADRMLDDDVPRTRYEARLLELLPDHFEDQIRAV
jgi:hypothetical protein